ncbi:MAG: DNA repair protein RecN [Roseateles sp.]|uniref:DNA repair protein RecN n=1 Tax=Roseateles sp. TaxID=1971397 RepID=UPI0039E7DE70
MLRHLSLKDFVIVPALELDFEPGFAVLTGETGAGKSILIDALQLALGGRGDAGVVREGAARAEITAEFDTPAHLRGWLDEAGFEPGDTLLLRRVIDAAGKSRAWISGGAATLTQLRELADHLLDIHGQHAWQGLNRPASVRELLDGFAGLDTAPLARAHAAWKQAAEALDRARGLQADAQRERERLAWQIGELDGLAPAEGEWAELNAEHERLSHGQSLLDAARAALDALDDGEPSAQSLASGALDRLERVLDHDARLLPAVQALRDVQAQLADASHTLAAYLHKTDLDPDRLAELDERVSAWLALARRYRRQPQELPALLAQWRVELAALDAASDPAQLEAALAAARQAYDAEAGRATRTRRAAAPQLAAAVTAAMQQLGMAGGRFDVALQAADAPQPWGAESAEFLVAGHAGSTPRPLAKVASGGELSRIALAIAVTTSQAAQAARGTAPGTLIFDEIDVGIGGAVAETVGRLMKQLGQSATGRRQVLAVTHLPQVAACADRHLVVAKRLQDGATASHVAPVAGEARVAEIARMLGGERLSSTSLAHAQEMLDASTAATTRPTTPRKARS